MSSATAPSSGSLARYDDHQNREHLEAVFKQKGNIAHTAVHFDISETTARRWLIRFDLYDPETQGVGQTALMLESMSLEDAGL